MGDFFRCFPNDFPLGIDFEWAVGRSAKNEKRACVCVYIIYEPKRGTHAIVSLLKKFSKFFLKKINSSFMYGDSEKAR